MRLGLRLSVLSLVFLLALALPGSAFAQAGYKSEQEFKDAMAGLSFEQARAQANADIRSVYGLGWDYHRATSEHGNHAANSSLWQNRHVFVYGQPHDFDPATGGHRYLGYTFPEEKYTNTLFRHDAFAGGWFTMRHWIEKPWEDERVESFLRARGEPLLEENSFNRAVPGDPVFDEISESALVGVLIFSNFSESAPFPDFVTLHDSWMRTLTDLGFRHTEAAQIIGRVGEDRLAAELAKYVHVLDPPTNHSFGMGRMFHQLLDGRVFYLTIPLFPLAFDLPKPVIPDFSAELIPDRFEAQAGQALTGTARYKLNDDHPQAETAWLRLHHLAGSEHVINLQPVNPADAPNAQGHVVFQPGDVKEYRYSFTVQAASQKIIARINPISVSHDKDWSNNRAEALIVQPCTDVRIAMSRSPGVRYAGDATRVTAVVTRANDGPAGSVPVRVRITGPGLNYDQTINLARGESWTINQVVTLNDPGSHVYQGSAWPVGIEDCVPANNTGSVTIPVQAAPRYDAGDSKIGHELGPGGDWKFGQP